MLPAAVKNKIEQIWLDVIAGGVSQPTEVIEQLTYLMFAKRLMNVRLILKQQNFFLVRNSLITRME